MWPTFHAWLILDNLLHILWFVTKHLQDNLQFLIIRIGQEELNCSIPLCLLRVDFIEIEQYCSLLIALCVILKGKYPLQTFEMKSL